MEFGLNAIKNDTIFGCTKEELGINSKPNYFGGVLEIVNNMDVEEELGDLDRPIRNIGDIAVRLCEVKLV